MKKYYCLSDYFVIHEGGKNTIIIIQSDGSEKRFDATQDSLCNRDLNVYLSQWPGMEISEQEFFDRLEKEKPKAVKRAEEAKKLIEAMYPPIDRIPF